jgi:hypothetical protein
MFGHWRLLLLTTGALFASELIPIGGPSSLRGQARRNWFARTADSLADADLVFVDPDNGLEPSGFSLGSAKSPSHDRIQHC